MYFGILGAEEKKTADILYNRKEGSKLTGSDVKALHMAISV